MLVGEDALQDASTCDELFSLLCRGGLLSRFNWPQLVELMSSVGRNDLATKVLVYGKKLSVQASPEEAFSLPEGDMSVSVCELVLVLLPLVTYGRLHL